MMAAAAKQQQQPQASPQRKPQAPSPRGLQPSRPLRSAATANGAGDNAAPTAAVNVLQMIRSHLASNNSAPNRGSLFNSSPPPPNMSSQARVPFVNYATTTTAKAQISPRPSGEAPTAIRHHVPTFKSNSLMIGSRHRVYCSYIEDGPKLFSIHLQSTEQDLDEMMSALGNCPLNNLSEKPSLGQACVARYAEDNNLYRAVIMSIKATSCTVAYVDYGNSAEVAFHDIYEIPASFLRHTIFAMRFTLAGYRQLKCTVALNRNFSEMVMEKELDLVVRPLDGPLFVQYCDLFVVDDNVNVFDRLLAAANASEKYADPPKLVQDELVIIRYVESPKKFFVQQHTNLLAYDRMMDKLADYCESAEPLRRLEAGAICATTYGQDKDCYRAEIVEFSDDRSLAYVQIVDFGIVISTNVGTLKMITPEFLTLPRQAIECCLEGFDTIAKLSDVNRDQLELLAEDVTGARRNFKVKIAQQEPSLVLNLIDDSASPVLDLATRMFKLAMPPKSFRQYEQQKYQRPTPAAAETQSMSATRENPVGRTSVGGGAADEPNSWRRPERSSPPRVDKMDHNGVISAVQQRLLIATTAAPAGGYNDDNRSKKNKR